MSLASCFLLIDKYGGNHALERLSPLTRVAAKMMMRRSEERPLMGDTSQYDVQFFVRHGTLTAAGFPVPPKKGDRIIQGQQVWTLENVEDMHDGTGNVGGYRMWCKGY